MLERFTSHHPHLTTTLLWVAVWLMALVGLRLLGWGIGLACEQTLEALL